MIKILKLFILRGLMKSFYIQNLSNIYKTINSGLENID
jgi:hypothetical protein